MKKTLLSLAIAFGIQLDGQTIDTVYNDTLMLILSSNGSIDSFKVTDIDSVIFLNRNDTIWVSSGACNGLTNLTYNGYTYDLIEIGNQCWFKENLQTTTYKDGTPIYYPGSNNTDWASNTSGAYAWYNNDSANYASTYGALYNWYAVDNSSGICPTGWHVPSDSTWKALENHLQTNGYNYDGSISGNKYAKAMAEDFGWDSYTSTGVVGNTDYSTYRNKSDFSALPGGYRYAGGSCGTEGDQGNWWTSSAKPGNYDSWYRNMHANRDYVLRSDLPYNYGISIRCIKD